MIRRPSIRPAAFLACSLVLASCAGSRPTNLGVKDTRLSPCPSSPNCVCSDDLDSPHAIPVFRLTGSSADGWRAAKAAVAALPRTTIVTQTDDYLHAECASAVLGFVDDLEFYLRSEAGVIAVRSASRLGYSDMGVNRRRIEELRAALTRDGVLTIEGVGNGD